MTEPLIIQGGMGVGVSSWRLANRVASLGQLGVVSGTALDAVLVRVLASGDPEGHIRRALHHFPFPQVADEILDEYFVQDRVPGTPFKRLALLSARLPAKRERLMVAAAFVEVYLAKENHDGRVGINFLEKIQMATLPGLYGAMLAGVDYVLMGAGIPREIPGVLDRLSTHQDVELKLHVVGALAQDDFRLRLSPRTLFREGGFSDLRRPKFLPIISSNALAVNLARKATGRIDGFVIEGATAGGHNAPPRGTLQLNERGEPIYGARDQVDLDGIRELNLPFWLAGGFGTPDGLKRALEKGAQGVQVGTAFALCEESGLAPDLRAKVVKNALAGELDVFTDPLASPTGFPFKVGRVPGTLTDPALYASRTRICDLGYLRQAYRQDDGALGYRCPSEPLETYLKKGGKAEETSGRLCLCNALMSNIGLAQVTEQGTSEFPLVTLGDDVSSIRNYVKPGKSGFSAQDVIFSLLETAKQVEVAVTAPVSPGQSSLRPEPVPC